MNIFAKFFERFKKKEEVKNDESWFNESAQKGEIIVGEPTPGVSLSTDGAYEAALTDSAVNSSC